MTGREQYLEAAIRAAIEAMQHGAPHVARVLLQRALAPPDPSRAIARAFARGLAEGQGRAADAP